MTTMTAVPEQNPVKKREIFGWAMYDFANSAYTTIVISIVYSAFFVNYLVPEGSAWRDLYWSIAINISTFLAMFLAPIAGVLCDFSGHKKVFLAVNTLVCSVFTCLLFFVDPGQIWLGITIVVISNTAWMLGEVFCASFLTDIATKENMGKVSGIGWGIGYIGGLTSLIIVLMVLVTADREVDLDLYIAQNQWAMLFTGLFFLLSAIPTFMLLKERSKPEPGFETIHWPTLIKAAIERMVHTVQIIKQLPVLFQFFLVFTIYSAGIAVIVKFFGIYVDSELGMSTGDKTNLFLALQISSLIGAIAFGYLESWIGPKKTIFSTLIWWICGILAIYYLNPLAAAVGMEPTKFFIIIGLVAGAGIGATQSASRAVVGLLSPKKYSAQLFGFWGMFGRIAIVVGSLSFALVSDTLGRQQGLLVVLGFFVAGAIAILFVSLDQGIIDNE